MHPDIDKSTEVRDVCDRAFENHAGFQVLDVIDPYGERRGFELGARIAARLFELEQNVAYGRQAEASSTNWDGSSDFSRRLAHE